ncbi:hypothetical protein SKAU_G00041920 [Synaphobranchus kaupii]|uniref:Uncharacterized protein n=1 Tax=Synaphobranchus kaupii TaxID=118154 RepID=A0A9Q1G1B7_SYNKA|nr:hypothetical protein SKAU_G00041920 [Synaphobranchus kaupii]
MLDHAHSDSKPSQARGGSLRDRWPHARRRKAELCSHRSPGAIMHPAQQKEEEEGLLSDEAGEHLPA